MLRDLLLFALAPLKRYAERHLVLWLDFGGDAPPPPDYTPVANASKEAAEISAQLGREQLAEAQRQYDQNMAVARPVVDAQLQVMRQGINQGNDYYNYQQNFRPLEQAMLANISGLTSGDMDRIGAMRMDATNTARSAWQQQQDARVAQLQQDIQQALAQEAQQAASLVQPQITSAQPVAPTSAAPTNIRDAFDLALSPFRNSGSSTDLAQTPSTQTSITINAPDPSSLRSARLQGELDRLRQQQFDGSGVDYSGANREAQRLMMAGMQAKNQADQADVDRITGEVRGNAAELMARTRAYEQAARDDIALATGGNQGIANKFAADIENDVGTAVADTRAGQTGALNTAMRQAMRYGLSVPSNAQALTNQNAAQLAAAANNTRTNSINNYRNLVAQGIGLKRDAFGTGQAATMDAMGKQEGASQQGRNMRIQNDSLNWAKQLDVAGMARGMPGASQGAYGVAVGAGNSATQNQMAPGQALVGAMGQSNATRMQGQQIAMQGLNGILGAQTSYANANAGGGDTFGSLLGGIGGAAAGLAKIGVFS